VSKDRASTREKAAATTADGSTLLMGKRFLADRQIACLVNAEAVV